MMKLRPSWFWGLVLILVALCWALNEANAGGPYAPPAAAPKAAAAEPAPGPEPAPCLALDDTVFLQPRPDLRLLCFGAEGCAPCAVDKPKIEEATKAAGLTCTAFDNADVQLIDCEESPKTTARYQVERIPCYVLIDGHGDEVQRAVGGGTWPELLKRITGTAPASSRAAGLRIGSLEGGRTSIVRLIDGLRPLLRDGGSLSLTYQVPKGPRAAEPAITFGGKVFRLGNPTQLAWSLEGDVLRCQLSPPAVVYVKGFPVKLRGVKLTPERILVDIPWLPDGEIEVR